MIFNLSSSYYYWRDINKSHTVDWKLKLLSKYVKIKACKLSFFKGFSMFLPQKLQLAYKKFPINIEWTLYQKNVTTCCERWNEFSDISLINLISFVFYKCFDSSLNLRKKNSFTDLTFEFLTWRDQWGNFTK